MNSNSIDLWAESFASQDETQFFNTIRLYLGEVKTPYNKQKLTSQLAAFIRKPETTSAILSLLDNEDTILLTAINLIPKASQETLVDFFKYTHDFSEIYYLLGNLTDRLLIYTTQDKYSDTIYYHINPLLQDSLNPYLALSTVLPDAEVSQFSFEDSFSLSPNFLAAFISYLKIHGCSCKADGIIKKNDLNRLEAIFPGKEKCLQYLVTAFLNLSLVREGEKKLIPDENRIRNFSKLSEIQQYALLCAASVSRFSRDGLKKEAQLLIDAISTIPENGYTRNSILRLAFLTGTYSEDGSAFAKVGRFSQMLQKARINSENESLQNAGLLDRMIDSAIEFGLLQFAGKTEDGTEVYKKGSIQCFTDSSEQPKVLNIESTFNATLMPGLTLKTLLPLTDFMSIKKCGVVTEFELSKASLSYSFDHDWNPDLITEEIEKYTYYELPQNLKINISDWYNSYSSALLYHGYVLKVSEKNSNLVENNPKISKYIKEKLADGIYMLNVPVNADISGFIAESGLDFMGNVKLPQNEGETLPFPTLQPAHNLSPLLKKSTDNEEILKASIQEAGALISSIRKHLDDLDFAKNKKESLEHRISRRLILSEQQLEIASIRNEILEADGMDFNGKIHLLELAIAQGDMLELQMPAPSGDGTFIKIVGKGLLLTKQPGEAIMRFQFEPGKEIENILISRITHIRRLRF